jgi:hypothetical protein
MAQMTRPSWRSPILASRPFLVRAEHFGDVGDVIDMMNPVDWGHD